MREVEKHFNSAYYWDYSFQFSFNRDILIGASIIAREAIDKLRAFQFSFNRDILIEEKFLKEIKADPEFFQFSFNRDILIVIYTHYALHPQWLSILF